MKRVAKNNVELVLILVFIGIACLFGFTALGKNTSQLISNLTSKNNEQTVTKAQKVTKEEAVAIETSGAAAFIASAKTPEEAFERLSQLMETATSELSPATISNMLSSVDAYSSPSGTTQQKGGIPPCSYCYYDDFTMGTLAKDGKLLSVDRINPNLGIQGAQYYMSPVNISDEHYFSTKDLVPSINFSVNRIGPHGSITKDSPIETYISYYVPNSNKSYKTIKLPQSLPAEQQQLIAMKIIGLVMSKNNIAEVAGTTTK